MFDPFTLGLLGSGIGALTGKDPLKGALVGGGLGAAGGAFLPGLLSAAAPAGGVVGGTGITAGSGVGLSPATAGTGFKAGLDSMAVAPSGIMENMKMAAEFAKPIGAAASAASSVKGLLDTHQAPIQAPMPMQQVGGSQALTQLAGQNQQSIDGQMQLAEQQRAQRRQMLRGGLL